MTRIHDSLRKAALAFAAALGAAVSVPAAAQDAGGHGAGPADLEKKILEIEKLMTQAERALARSSGTGGPAEAAKRLDELLDEKSKKEAGKSASQLKEEAANGSKEASETLAKLMEQARREMQQASSDVSKLLSGARSDSEGSSKRLEWILEQVKSSSQSPPSGGGGGGGGGQKEPKPQEKKPESGKEEDKKDDDKKKPEDKKPDEPKREKPKNAEFEQWYAQLPSQVRRAYETQDWDSIPPQFRTVLREWTKKMAEEMDKEPKAPR